MTPPQTYTAASARNRRKIRVGIQVKVLTTHFYSQEQRLAANYSPVLTEFDRFRFAAPGELCSNSDCYKLLHRGKKSNLGMAPPKSLRRTISKMDLSFIAKPHCRRGQSGKPTEIPAGPNFVFQLNFGQFPPLL